MPDKTFESVSASQVPALFGHSPYFTKRMLYEAFKARDLSLIEPPPSDRMELGKRFQPMILARVAEVYRLEVVPNEDDQYMIAGRVGCTLDAHMTAPDRGRMVVEAKRTHWLRWRETWTGTAAPIHIELQLQTQMLVTGWSRGLIACDYGDDELQFLEREADPEIALMIHRAAHDFFDDLANDRAPNPLSDPMELPLLAHLYPTADPTKVIENFDDDALAAAVIGFDKARDEQKFHEKLADQYKATLLAAAGDAGVLRVNGATAYVKKFPVKASMCEPHAEPKQLRKAGIQTRIEVVRTEPVRQPKDPLDV
jgi:hypothetical protein